MRSRHTLIIQKRIRRRLASLPFEELEARFQSLKKDERLNRTREHLHDALYWEMKEREEAAQRLLEEVF
jgi:hypothetical protein